MAIKKVIEIDVNTLNAQGGLDTFVETLKQTEQKSISLKAELRQLKEEMARLPEGSAKYKEISARAGEVSDRIIDINTEIKNLGSDTKHIDGIVEGAQAMSGAFSIATSASALLGDENKDLQEQMMKVESAIGLTIGVQSVANALQKESALMIGISNVATKVQIALQYAYATAVGGTTGALKALRLALATSGIGAIVLLIGALITAFAKSKDATDEQVSAQDRFNQMLERTNFLLNKNTSLLEASKNQSLLRAKIAGKSEEEIFKLERSFAEEKTKLLRKDFDKKADLANLFRQKTIELQGDADKKELEAVREQQKKLDDDKQKAKEAFYGAKQSEIELSLGYDLKLADQQREAEAKKLEEQRKAYEKRREELAKQREQELLDFLDFQKKINLADLEQINLKIEERFNQDQNLLDGTRLAIEQLDNEDKKRTENEKAQSDARKEILKLELQARENQVAGIASALSDLASIAGESTGVGKGLAVASTLISTYSSAQKAYESAFLPIPTPASPALGAVFAGVAVASGLANVKKILSVKAPNLKGGGGSAGASASAPSVASAPPSFNIVGNAGTNQIASTIGARQAEPIRAYVVSTQITTAQNLDRNIIQSATLG